MFHRLCTIRNAQRFAKQSRTMFSTKTSLTPKKSSAFALVTSLTIGGGVALSYTTTASPAQAAAPTYTLQQLQGLKDRIQSLEKMLKDQLLAQPPSAEFKNVQLIDSPAVRMLFTVIRDKGTANPEYVRYADRLMTLLAEEGLARISVKKVQVTTPCGLYEGIKGPDPEDMCVVSIPRSGDILMEAVRRVSVGISVGKILCQRDESDPLKRAKLFYSKLPLNIHKKKVLLVDPMVATGGSASLAIRELVKAGVKAENITFLNVVSCPTGLKKLEQDWPTVQIITAAIDPILNSDKFIVPGLGDFGDRYYRTDGSDLGTWR